MLTAQELLEESSEILEGINDPEERRLVELL